ncbi:MAG: UDP-glucose 4-epimerase GalE [Kiritimatiellae bacterium]|nr:UDP-glucose 4-epimerase GalE [Kiritimatiellia bacterium]
MNILVTGGAGYIGSHTCIAAFAAGHEITVLDNLSNSSPEALRRVGKIAGKVPRLVVGDIGDRSVVKSLLDSEKFDAVIHFAGYKAVGESVSKPWEYYVNNISGTLVLLDEMRRHGLYNLIFSSSATVYGNPLPENLPLKESAPLAALNPYGQTKLWLEDVMRAMSAADPAWHILLLRYFNPVGAHESGLIGEDPAGIPNNLMPYITQVAVGRLKELTIFGDDWPTPDGTCIRDYIHVCDLAEGHVAALAKVAELPGCTPINLGSGSGVSVAQLVASFEKATGRPLPHKIGPRRAGDAAACYADASRALELLGWKTKRDSDAMCRDAWRWQSMNPKGYK